MSHSEPQRPQEADYFPDTFRLHLDEFIALHARKILDGEQYLLSPHFPRQYLDFISTNQRVFFCSFLALAVLLDQTIYSHFPESSYQLFREHMQPVVLKVKYGLTWLHANPWVLLNYQPREQLFRSCVQIFLNHTKNLCTRGGFLAWNDLMRCMIADPDVRRTRYGEWFCFELENASKLDPSTKERLQQQLGFALRGYRGSLVEAIKRFDEMGWI